MEKWVIIGVDSKGNPVRYTSAPRETEREAVQEVRSRYDVKRVLDAKKHRDMVHYNK